MNFLGPEFYRNWLISFTLTLPTLRLKNGICSNSCFLLLISYLTYKWFTHFNDSDSLYVFLLYEITFFFCIFFMYQKWSKVFEKHLQQLSSFKILNFVPAILIIDMMIPGSVTQNLNLYHNPLRDIFLKATHFKRIDHGNRKIEFISKQEKQLFILIDSPHFTVDFIQSINSIVDDLNQNWLIKKQILLTYEQIDRSSFFIQDKKDVNFTIGKTPFLSENDNISFSSITPEEDYNFNSKRKIRALYSLLKQENTKPKRIYLNLEPDHLELTQGLSVLNKGFYELKLIYSLLKKLDMEFKNTKFSIVIIGNTNNDPQEHPSKILENFKPLYFLSNEVPEKFVNLSPLNISEKNTNKIPELDLAFERSERGINFSSISGVFYQSKIEISFERLESNTVSGPEIVSPIE